MTLTVNKILENIRHELGGGDLSIELDKYGIINEAGEHLYSMYPWKWAQGRSALLDLRGNVTGSTATWTASTKTLTAASAFTNYSYVSGDEIEINAGTDVTTGVYKIASRTSASAIVLEDSIAADDEAAGDIEWAIYPGTIELPTDLRDIISIQSSSTSSIVYMTLVSLDEINSRRGANSITESPSLFYGAVVYSGTTPVPVLEIWPSSGSNQTGALRIFYRSRWTHIYTDNATVAIPEFIDSLYLWIVRAFAAGYERGGSASIHARLAEIRASPIFEAARRSDGQTQPFRKLRNGGATIWRNKYGSSEDRWIVNRVPGPT